MDNESISCLLHAVRDLTGEIKSGFEWFRSHHGLITKHDLREMEDRIMNKLETFFANQKTFNERQAKGIDTLVEAITGVSSDIEALNKKIADLIAASGDLTPEQQTIADQLTTDGEALATRVEGAAATLKGLDDANPPVVPTPEPTR